MIEVKYGGLRVRYILCLLCFMMGIGEFWVDYMLDDYPPIQMQNPFKTVLLAPI